MVKTKVTEYSLGTLVHIALLFSYLPYRVDTHFSASLKFISGGADTVRRATPLSTFRYSAEMPCGRRQSVHWRTSFLR